MVSNSRFDDDLILLGLLPDQEDSRSILNIQVRDPQGDMTTGFRPQRRRREMPLTKMAAEATAGNAGIDGEGYRDYRGVPVVGAWHWMQKYQMGVATEVDVAEAYRPLTILQYTFWVLFGMLVLSSAAIFVFTLIVARLQREAQRAAIEAQQLGQYTLEEKLGSGAMGIVYKGHHAMLRRPTAIKMLDVDTINDSSIRKRGADYLSTESPEHDCDLRLWADSRRSFLLCHGVLGRNRPADFGRRLWPTT